MTAIYDAKKTGPRKLHLFMGNLERLRNDHILDVIRLGMRPKNVKPIVPLKSPSDEVMDARRALANDPYNLQLMSDLAYRYTTDGRLEQCINVLLRGWKRASEFEDASMRFCFLMKLAELSTLFGKHKQAAAVLADITEPEDAVERKSYFLLSCRVKAANKDGLGALAAFQKTLDGEDAEMAVRLLAVCMMDLKIVGSYQAARGAVEKLSPEATKGELEIMDRVAEQDHSSEPSAGIPVRAISMAVVVLLFALLVPLLYYLEQASLQKHKLKW